MATTIGSVEFKVGADGSALERQLRQIGARAGRAGGKEMGAKFNDSFEGELTGMGDSVLAGLRKKMERQGAKSGRLYGLNVRTAMRRELVGKLDSIANEIAKVFTFDDTDAFENLARKMGGADAAAEHLGSSLVRLRSEGRLNGREFESLTETLDEYHKIVLETENAEKARLRSMLEIKKAVEDQAEAVRQLDLEKARVESKRLADEQERLALRAGAVRDAMDRLHEKMGSSSAFTRFVDQVGDTRLAMIHLNDEIRNVERETGDSTWASRLRVRLLDLGDAFRKASSDGGETDRTLGDLWKNLSFNFRQGLVIVAAVASAMQQIAVLGSAAGAGLLVLGGAAAGALVGVAGLASAIFTLAGDIDKVPKSIRGAAEAFKALGEPISELRDTLAEHVFAGTEEMFRNLKGTIEQLSPSVAILGDWINRVVKGFGEWATSTKGIELMSSLIEKSGPIFEKLMNIVGKLGEALLIAFDSPAMQKAIDNMLDGIDGLVQTFSDFVSSDDFGTWMENTMGVMAQLGDLIGGLSALFDNLVTPEAYERTNQFLTSLTEALPGLTSMLSALGALDVFGVLAEALNVLMSALQPVFQTLEPLLQIVRDMITLFGEALQSVLMALAPLFVPIQLGFEVMSFWFGKIIEYFTPFMDAWQELMGAFNQAAAIIWEQLQPAFEDVWNEIKKVLPTADEFTAWVKDEAIPAIQDFAQWLGKEGAKAIKDFANWLRTDGIPMAQSFWNWIQNNLVPALKNVGTFMSAAGTAVSIGARIIKTAFETLTAPIRFVIDLFKQVADWAGRAFGKVQSVINLGSTAGGLLGGLPGFASGGVLTGPRHILAGEAGPEAIVPLRRNLNQVDPSVRALSAIAQGMGVPAMASGGVVGGGRTNVIEAGAIVVQEASSALATGVEILNRITNNLD